MTKTRAMAIIMILIMLLSQSTVFADDGLVEVEVSIVENKVHINNKAFSNDELKFPFIKHNDVIYLPLAWNTVESVGFQLTVKEDVITLTKDLTDEKNKVTLDKRGSALSKQQGSAIVKDVEILIGDQPLKRGKYPILKFSDVNYIPLTWNVLKQMDLYYSANLAKGININTVSQESLDSEVKNADEAYLKQLSMVIRNINRNVSEKEADKLVNIIMTECGKAGIDETWIMAVIWKESRFETDCDYNGAVGIMQILVSTGKNFGLSKNDLYDPEKSIRAGVSYLKSGFDKFQSMEKAILAYNQGSYRVEKGTYKTGYLDSVKEKRDQILEWLK